MGKQFREAERPAFVVVKKIITYFVQASQWLDLYTAINIICALPQLSASSRHATK